MTIDQSDHNFAAVTFFCEISYSLQEDMTYLIFLKISNISQPISQPLLCFLSVLCNYLYHDSIILVLL